MPEPPSGQRCTSGACATASSPVASDGVEERGYRLISQYEGGPVMKTLLQRTGVLLVSLMVLALPVTAADAPKVLNIITVKVKGDQNTYLQRVKQLNTIQKRLEAGGTMRVWRATVAGQDVGTIYVGFEYANLEAFAKAITKVQADEEWNKVIKDLDASGLREVIGNSLLAEITP